MLCNFCRYACIGFLWWALWFEHIGLSPDAKAAVVPSVVGGRADGWGRARARGRRAARSRLAQHQRLLQSLQQVHRTDAATLTSRVCATNTQTSTSLLIIFPMICMGGLPVGITYWNMEYELCNNILLHISLQSTSLPALVCLDDVQATYQPTLHQRRTNQLNHYSKISDLRNSTKTILNPTQHAPNYIILKTSIVFINRNYLPSAWTVVHFTYSYS